MGDGSVVCLCMFEDVDGFCRKVKGAGAGKLVASVLAGGGDEAGEAWPDRKAGILVFEAALANFLPLLDMLSRDCFVNSFLPVLPAVFAAATDLRSFVETWLEFKRLVGLSRIDLEEEAKLMVSALSGLCSKLAFSACSDCFHSLKMVRTLTCADSRARSSGVRPCFSAKSGFAL